MARPGYKDLGISSKEYEEALLLERLFKLVKKNPCSTCLLKKPTHVDLDRFDLVCTTCSKRCSSKVQIGKGLISMSDLERLESIYDKSKKKTDHSSSKHKKHKPRSPSVSSYDSYDDYKKSEKYRPSESESSRDHRKHKHRSKKKENRQQDFQEYYPEHHDNFETTYSTKTHSYPPLYPEHYPSLIPPYQTQFTHYHSHHKSKKDKRDKSKEKRRERDDRLTRDQMGFEMPRDHERKRETYPQLSNYPFYQQSRHREHDSYQPSYKHTNRFNRNYTGYDYVNFPRREVPGMVGLLANKSQDQDTVFRNQWTVPALEDKAYTNRMPVKHQSLALTNSYQGFRSLPNFQNEERVSNNPFSRRNFDQTNQAYNFSNMREALNPPKTNSRYPDTFQPPRDFQSTKLGNPSFPDSNYYNRF